MISVKREPIFCPENGDVHHRITKANHNNHCGLDRTGIEYDDEERKGTKGLMVHI